MFRNLTRLVTGNTSSTSYHSQDNRMQIVSNQRSSVSRDAAASYHNNETAAASKYKGVYKCGKKWKTQIQIDGIQHYIGVFDTQEEAAEEYYKASVKFGRNYKSQHSSPYDPILDNSNDTFVVQDQSSLDHDNQIVVPTKLLAALKLKLQLGKITLQIHCDQIHIQELMTKIDSTTSRQSNGYHTLFPAAAVATVADDDDIRHCQETITTLLNNIQHLLEEQTSVSYQLASIDFSNCAVDDLERLGLSSAAVTTASSTCMSPPHQSYPSQREVLTQAEVMISTHGHNPLHTVISPLSQTHYENNMTYIFNHKNDTSSSSNSSSFSLHDTSGQVAGSDFDVPVHFFSSLQPDISNNSCNQINGNQDYNNFSSRHTSSDSDSDSNPNSINTQEK